MPGFSTTRTVGVHLHASRAALGLTMLCAWAMNATADTIVLKNGRRIVALTVVEDGDKVRYQTSAGELSLPKSIVDHIEKGVATPPPDSLSAAAAASLKMTPPTVEANAAVVRGAVHDDAIDREYIARMEGEARSGTPEAKETAALALHSAAQFELSRGETERALVDERRALTYAPEEPGLLMS